MTTEKKLSGPMRQVLFSLLNGNPASYHCATRSDYGGLRKVLCALRVRGLITSDEKLTQAGRAVAREIADG